MSGGQNRISDEKLQSSHCKEKNLSLLLPTSSVTTGTLAIDSFSCFLSFSEFCSLVVILIQHEIKCQDTQPFCTVKFFLSLAAPHYQFKSSAVKIFKWVGSHNANSAIVHWSNCTVHLLVPK